VEVPEPVAGPGEVRVRVHAAAVNPTDTLLVAGVHAARMRDVSPPYIPGTDAAGVVDQLGADADGRLAVGQRVVALVVPVGPRDGAYADQVVVPAASVVAAPDGVDDPAAATLLMNALTARLALDALALAPGQPLAVTGAAGAFGGYAVQLGRADGLRVLADAAPRDEALVRELGAHDVVARVRAWRSGSVRCCRAGSRGSPTARCWTGACCRQRTRAAPTGCWPPAGCAAGWCSTSPGDRAGAGPHPGTGGRPAVRTIARVTSSSGPQRPVILPWRRLVAYLCLALAALVVAGCAPAPIPKAPPAAAPGSQPRAVPKPTNCTQSLTDPGSAQQGLDAAKPGDRLCIFGTYVQDAQLRMGTSGTAAQPITLISDGSTLAGIRVDANNVVVEGFNTNGGRGIKARGANITIRNNDVRGAADDGIRCEPCTNVTIQDNLVKGADGTGILVSSNGGTVSRNDVSGSVRKEATDADGVRFFGTKLKIENNYVHDISQKGYPAGTEPHTDCFQTYDSDAPTTWGVVVSNNRCINVDAQCLIASGTDRHNAGVPAGQIAIQFLNNECKSGAVQGVYLEGYPNVVIRGNHFESNYDSAVLIAEAATNVKINDNVLVGQGMDPYQIDATSRPGFDESNNIAK
jgi:parallel beta-helix repeat protein